MIPIVFIQILTAAVYFIVMSFLYKENNLFSVVEGIAIGFAVSNSLMLLGRRAIDMIAIPLLAGDLEKLIPLFFGVLMYTFFTVKYRGVYRAVLMGYILIVYGVTFGMGLQDCVRRFVEWGSLISIGGVATIIVITTTLLYLIYSEKLHGTTKYPGYLGYFFLIWMFGWMVGMFQVKHTIGFVQIFTEVMAGTGVYIMIIAALVLVVDIFYGWKKILGLQAS